MKTRRSRFMALASGAALLLGMGLHLWASTAEAGCAKTPFPATGQTTAYTAILQDGTSAVAVPDDGTVEAGAELRYVDNGNGTVTDKNTKLTWEKKVAGSSCLHCVGDAYPWSNPTTPGANPTIWDWLAQVNAEGGVGLASKRDWRISNVKELQSIADYGRCGPPGGNCADQAAIDPMFGPTAVSDYWSSTTLAASPALAWVVGFGFGSVLFDDKSVFSHALRVRAVRGGCVD